MKGIPSVSSGSIPNAQPGEEPTGRKGQPYSSPLLVLRTHLEVREAGLPLTQATCDLRWLSL